MIGNEWYTSNKRVCTGLKTRFLEAAWAPIQGFIGRLFRALFRLRWRGGGLGSRPKKMYGERLGDGVEYHLMSPTPEKLFGPLFRVLLGGYSGLC